MIGSTVAHFRILDKIGEGGMGVVYKAEDTRLGRTVALKVISPRLIERRATAVERFLREARLASSLNHPHICTIYDVGEDDGRFFMAIELLEGQTLHQLAATRPLPNEQIVHLALQIANGLAEAHGKGIVHRDIKPENIFITTRGTAKIMDFGLAKLSAEPTDPTDSNSITASISPALTEPGVTFGTAAYMSPEQARGEELDNRSDLFSFGGVLYYMATGTPPFRGHTTAVIFHSLLQSDPPLPSDLNAALPPRLQDVIMKALEKDRDLRYQSAREIAVDLQRSLRAPGTESAPATAAHRSRPGRSQWSKPAALVAAVLLGTAITAYLLYTQFAGAEPFERIVLSPLTDSGRALQPAISPDGRYVVYVDESSGAPALWLRQVSGESAVQILPPEDVEYGGITVAPDGNSVYFVRYEPATPHPGNMYRVPTLGGAPRLIVANVISAPTFSPDGRRMAFIRKDPLKEESLLVLANADGTGESVLLSQPLRAGGFVVGFGGRGVAPAWSPDGRTIAVGTSATHAGMFENINAGILAVDVATGAPRRIPIAGRSVGRMAWTADGKRLLLTGWEIGTRELRGQISLLDISTGRARRVTQDLSNYTHADLSVAADGHAFAAVEERTEDHVWMAPQGDFSRAVEVTSGSRSWRHGLARLGDGRLLAADSDFGLAVFNIDGTRIQAFVSDPHPQWGPASCGARAAFIRLASLEESELWVADSDGNRARKVLSGRLGNPTCTPDGQWAVLNFPDARGPGLSKVSTITGEQVRLLSRRSFPSAVSPNGDVVAVVFEESQPEPARHFALVPIDGGDVRMIARNVKFAYSALRWTSDGTAIAYVLTRHGVSNIWRQPLDGAPASQITSFSSGTISDFAWAPNGDVWFARGPHSTNIVVVRDAR